MSIVKSDKIQRQFQEDVIRDNRAKHKIDKKTKTSVRSITKNRKNVPKLENAGQLDYTDIIAKEEERIKNFVDNQLSDDIKKADKIN